MATGKHKTGEDPETITTGLNDRPRGDTIGQSGGGLPDDSGKTVDIDPEEEARIARKLKDAPGG